MSFHFCKSAKCHKRNVDLQGEECDGVDGGISMKKEADCLSRPYKGKDTTLLSLGKNEVKANSPCIAISS